MNRAIDTHDASYQHRMKRVLLRHYYRGLDKNYFETECGKNNLADHVSGRYRMAADHVVPWLNSAFDLSNRSVIEIGCGTGSSTLAFAPAVGSVECYEIDKSSVSIAKERLACWDVTNVHFHPELFNGKCRFVRGGNRADAILLYATLEHMTHVECLSILELCWRVLKSKGILIVAETPNRLSPMDEHTSWLPFFAQLPREIQVAYASNSPREDFRNAISSARKWSRFKRSWALQTMTRWGSGISYHEFELGVGKDVHQHIVLDGFEPEIASMFPISEIDQGLEELCRRYAPHVHRAFARRTMFFALEKP